MTVGQTYTVSFYQAAGQQYGDSGATTEQWQVSLGSDTQISAVMNTPSEGVFLWEPQTLTYTASSTSELLSFLAVGSGGVPPIVFLDGVDMESSVPEPSACLLIARRRHGDRHRQAAAAVRCEILCRITPCREVL